MLVLMHNVLVAQVIKVSTFFLHFWTVLFRGIFALLTDSYFPADILARLAKNQNLVCAYM